MAEINGKRLRVARHWTLTERLAYYSEPGTDGCLLFVGPVKNGYGNLIRNSVHHYTHRLAWELARGPIPPGMFVCHKCDVPRCVNPDHLFLGTQSDNVADMINKGRQADGFARASRGSAHGCSKLTEEQARAIFCATGTLKDIGARYGIHLGTVHAIKRKRTWRHLHVK